MSDLEWDSPDADPLGDIARFARRAEEDYDRMLREQRAAVDSIVEAIREGFKTHHTPECRCSAVESQVSPQPGEVEP